VWKFAYSLNIVILQSIAKLPSVKITPTHNYLFQQFLNTADNMLAKAAQTGLQ
jgi:hypothetical protein